jgi:hypothetical protein
MPSNSALQGTTNTGPRLRASVRDRNRPLRVDQIWRSSQKSKDSLADIHSSLSAIANGLGGAGYRPIRTNCNRKDQDP